MAHSEISVGSHVIARVTGLKNHEGSFQNAATVTLESLVERQTGAAVTGISLPLTLSYKAASDGVYEGQIPNNTSMEAGKYYIATIKAVSGPFQKTWKETVRVVNAHS
jgi:hypothetical protein